MRSSRLSTLRDRARRPLRLRLLSIVTSRSPVDGPQGLARAKLLQRARNFCRALTESSQKTLFGSYEPKQSKRLSERVSTDGETVCLGLPGRTFSLGTQSHPAAGACSFPLFNAVTLGYLNIGKKGRFARVCGVEDAPTDRRRLQTVLDT
jgi:hypothetical protein